MGAGLKLQGGRPALNVEEGLGELVIGLLSSACRSRKGVVCWSPACRPS